MTIGDTYSSWVRNRLGPTERTAIRNAGEGRVDFIPAVGKPLGWVGCKITLPMGGTKVAVGPDPLSAFLEARRQGVTPRG